MSSIKDLKRQLAANKKVLKKVNKPTTNNHYKQITDKDVREETKEPEQMVEEREEKQTLIGRLMNQNKQIKKKLKSKKRHKATKNGILIATFIVPILMFFTIIILAFSMIAMSNLNNAAATIASLVDPKQRAILKARGLLEDNAITEIPKTLVGNLPGSAGFDLSAGDSKKDSADDADISNSSNPKSIAKSFWILAKAKGYTLEQAAAVLGNWDVESAGLRTSISEIGKGSLEQAIQAMKTTRGFQGGYGLGQWTAGRNHNLYKAHPKDFSTVKGQVTFFFNEGTYNMSHPKNNLYLGGGSARNDLTAATNAFLNNWEAPANPNATRAERQQRARKWYSYLKGLNIQ